MFKRFHARAFLACLWMGVLAASMAGCASTPQTPAPIFVTGNGHCRPAADLPSHKVMSKVPEKPTYPDELYGLLLNERMSHKQDIDQYNSLYTSCAEVPVE